MSSIWLRNGFSLSLCIRTTPMLFVSTYISNRKGVNYNSRALNNIFPCLITYTYEFRGWMTSRVEFLSHISFFYIYEILLPCNSRKIYVQDIEWQLIPTCHQKISFRVWFIVIWVRSDGNIVLIEFRYILSSYVLINSYLYFLNWINCKADAIRYFFL